MDIWLRIFVLIKVAKFGTEDYDNKMSTNMYGTTTEVVSRNKDIENFWESVNLWKTLMLEFVIFAPYRQISGAHIVGF